MDLETDGKVILIAAIRREWAYYNKLIFLCEFVDNSGPRPFTDDFKLRLSENLKSKFFDILGGLTYLEVNDICNGSLRAMGELIPASFFMEVRQELVEEQSSRRKYNGQKSRAT